MSGHVSGIGRLTGRRINHAGDVGHAGDLGPVRHGVGHRGARLARHRVGHRVGHRIHDRFGRARPLHSGVRGHAAVCRGTGAVNTAAPDLGIAHGHPELVVPGVGGSHVLAGRQRGKVVGVQPVEREPAHAVAVGGGLGEGGDVLVADLGEGIGLRPGNQDEGALGRARMRQDQFRIIGGDALVGDDVHVQGARTLGLGAHAPGVVLQALADVEELTR